MSSKIWIASKDVGFSYDHLYLVYDPDGDPHSGDELIFRGGPENNNFLNFGQIVIEKWVPIILSEDSLGAQSPFSARNYTELTGLGNKTPEQVKESLSTWANAFGVTDSNGKIVTTIPYSLPIDLTNDSAQFKPALNSNTTIRSALESVSIDIAANYPRDGGVGVRMSSTIFQGSESYYTASDSTVDISNSVDRVIYSTGGNNTYELQANSLHTGTIYIVEDDLSATINNIVIRNINPADIHYERGLDGTLRLFLPWDASDSPSVIIVGQWIGGIPSINNLIVYENENSNPTLISVLSKEDVHLDLGISALDSISVWFSQMQNQFDRFSTRIVDPLVIDLDGDGVKADVTIGSQVYFDIDNDGIAEAVSWVNGNDGILARDLNNNGKIDDATEVFGNTISNGFDDLRVLDTNNDGQMTAADAAFSALKIWKDSNANGITDAGELTTLAQNNIASITVSNYTATNGDKGVSHIGTATTTSGQIIEVANDNEKNIGVSTARFSVRRRA